MARSAGSTFWPCWISRHRLAIPIGRRYFSILASQSSQGASFGSVTEFVAHIEAFISSYNEHAHSFVWTKSVVHQKRLKPGFAI
jgi:hypothetical protein